MGFPGKNTAVGCHSLLQGVFPTQGLSFCLLCLLQAGFFTTTGNRNIVYLDFGSGYITVYICLKLITLCMFRESVCVCVGTL